MNSSSGHRSRCCGRRRRRGRRWTRSAVPELRLGGTPASGAGGSGCGTLGSGNGGRRRLGPRLARAAWQRPIRSTAPVEVGLGVEAEEVRRGAAPAKVAGGSEVRQRRSGMQRRRHAARKPRRSPARPWRRPVMRRQGGVKIRRRSGDAPARVEPADERRGGSGRSGLMRPAAGSRWARRARAWWMAWGGQVAAPDWTGVAATVTWRPLIGRATWRWWWTRPAMGGHVRRHGGSWI